MTDFNAIAARIRAAYDSGVPCAPVRDNFTNATVADAYAVQEINTTHWLAAGRRLVGRKIGLTAKSVQTQLKVDQPDYGMLYADMAFADGEDVPLARVLQPRAEAEVALVLGRDLKQERHTVAEIIAAVDHALPAIEVVGSRIADWDIGILDTIADNASSGLFVLGVGPRKLADFDPVLCGMVMERRGEPVSVGCGRACLGNPLASARWLADTMVAARRPLLAGDIVLTGALGPVVGVAPGDVVEARINGLGAVTAFFA